MAKDFVKVKGKKHFVAYGQLYLANEGITDISEIDGLEHLTNFQELNLSNNQIKEIKGLEHLTQLQWLIILSQIEERLC
jgi:internalin A